MTFAAGLIAVGLCFGATAMMLVIAKGAVDKSPIQ